MINSAKVAAVEEQEENKGNVELTQDGHNDD